MRFPGQIGAGRDRGRWLVPLFLLIGVLAPTACVLWFLNVAVDNQRDASRRKLSDAYRGQLTLLRDRADGWWERRAGALDKAGGTGHRLSWPAGARDGDAPAVFERLVVGGLADSAVVLDASGSPAYPSIAVPAAADAAYNRPDWRAARALEGWGDFAGAATAYEAIAKGEQDIGLAARAAQAYIRCLARSDKNAALRAVEEHFTSGPLMRGAGLDGRLIAADEQLLALHIMGAADRRYAAALARLHGLVADYAGAPLPSTQRLFLMDELGAPGFPTYEAERLAARVAEGAGQPFRAAGEATLRPAGIPGLWQFMPPGGRVVALYRTATVVSAMQQLGNGLDARLTVCPPLAGESACPTSGAESLPAGSRLPGWQLALSPKGAPLDEIARRQTVSYVWVGFLAIAVVAISAAVAAQAFRRQWRLARLKTDLVAAVSHELKTPLSSMRLLVDALLEEDRPDARKTREYLELIARENLRLSRLIENFLTFSRLERNRQRLEFAPTQPESVIHATLEAFAERLPGETGGPETSVEPGLPAVRADKDALVTALLNLLDNAYKYTPGERQIVLRAFREGRVVVFAVEDNGIGIAPRERKRIFRRFYQVDRRLARESGGCGLGLSIVDAIVKAHGGRVRVSSEPGKGSVFAFALPCAEAERGAA